MNKLSTIYACVFLSIGASSCAFIEFHVETQQTARTLSEAKRNPVMSDSDSEKQSSLRTQENPKTGVNQVVENTQTKATVMGSDVTGGEN